MRQRVTARLAGWKLAVAVAGVVALLSGGAVAQETGRDLSGVVTDAHHEPLKGAVVQLEDENTHAVTSFVTDSDGHYHFKRVATNANFRVFATYDGHHSKAKELSKFSSKAAPFVRLVVDAGR